jgi:AcrR family transcriptional regulator
MATTVMELPVLGTEPHERADAARNRRRILAAAQKLFAQNGVHCTSMDAIAAEAGVGKGTLFRRFGDRASLALAVLDESERALQDAIISGPPPLGPGAPPCRRLIAFGAAMLDRLSLHCDLLIDAEIGRSGAYLRSEPHAVHWLHVHALVEEARPDCDVDYTTDVLLGALTAQIFAHQRRVRAMDLDRLKAGYADLVSRMFNERARDGRAANPASPRA